MLQGRPDKALAFLAGLATEFTSVLNLPDLLEHVMRVLREETGLDSCSLALLDEDNPGALIIRAASGLRESFRDLAVPAGKGLHGTVMETGKPLLIPDMHADPRVYRREPRVRSGMYAPLTIHGRQIGVLSAHRETVGAFTEADLNLLTIVARYITGAIEVARLHEQVKAVASTDSLTRLANRRHFLDHLGTEMSRSRRHGHPLTLVLMDLDGFKRINDAYGHIVGDQMLIRVAENLSRTIRPSDLAARYGGDEFILLLPETTGAQAVETLKRLKTFEIPVPDHQGVSAQLSFSWGTASFPDDGRDSERLLQVADGRLYAMKQRTNRE